MNDYKKHQIKEWFKKRIVLVGSIAFLIVGFALFIIGFGLANGWDYIPEMLGQPYAVTCYIIIGVALCILGIMFYLDFMRKKG